MHHLTMGAAPYYIQSSFLHNIQKVHHTLYEWVGPVVCTFCEMWFMISSEEENQ